MIPYGRSRFVAVRWVTIKSYRRPLTFNWGPDVLWSEEYVNLEITTRTGWCGNICLATQWLLLLVTGGRYGVCQDVSSTEDCGLSTPDRLSICRLVVSIITGVWPLASRSS